MILIEDKLELFSKIVFEKIEKDIEEKKARFQKEIFDPYNESIKQYEDYGAKILKEYQSKSQQKYATVISRAKSKARMDVLKKYKDIIEQVIEGLKQRCLEFINQPDYREYVKNCLNKTFAEVNAKAGSLHLLFGFTQKDMNSKKAYIDTTIHSICGNTTYELYTINSSYIGGFICTNRDKTFRLDYTLASLIEDNKDIIAGRVQESLEQNNAK